MHGVDVPADWIAPARGSLAAECVRRVAIVDRYLRVEIRITGHRLALAVDEQLVDRASGGRLRPVDPVAARLPSEFQPSTAADHHRLTLRGSEDHRSRGAARIVRGEDQRLEQVVGPAMHPDRRRLAWRPLANRLLCTLQRRKRPLVRPRMLVIAVWRDVKLRRPRCCRRDPQPQNSAHPACQHSVSPASQESANQQRSDFLHRAWSNSQPFDYLCSIGH